MRQPQSEALSLTICDVRTSRGFQNALTAGVAVLVTVASASGMWGFFRDILGFSSPALRAIVFAVFELAQLASALRARMHRIRYGVGGVDERAVWVLAIVMGTLAASDMHTWWGRVGRIVLPLLAAWLLHRAIAAEADDARGTRKAAIRWRFDVERVAVRLGLAVGAPAGPDLRLDRLAALVYRRHTSSRRRHQRQVQRAFTAAIDILGADGIAELRQRCALLYGADEATMPAAVAGANPWLPVAAGPAAVSVPLPVPPAVPRPPAAAGAGRLGRRTAGETAAAYAALMDAEPGLSKTEVLERLGIKDRQFRAAAPAELRRH